MIIYAVNVNTGGGKVLLDRLLVENPFATTTAAFLDKRYAAPPEFKGKTFSFSVISRLTAEKNLHSEIKASTEKEQVLFFGNLPPFFKPKVESFLYLQNCYLTGQVPLPTDSPGEWLRNLLESWLLKLFYRNVNEIWVQTEWMKEMTLKWCPKATVKIKPFLPILPKAVPQLRKKYKFTYVGSLSSNKGLSSFLIALKELDANLKEKIDACVVLNNNFSEALEISDFATDLKNISLHLKCRISREDLFRIYETTEYLVVTTLYESYYLPVYEALHFGGKIIASKEAGYLSHLHGSKNFSFYKYLDLKEYI